ncbi:exo-alpha-sialidase [Acidobacteria bacterium AH-259-A15]|nr:exo-alpha-sialidase [Acidobacteria bacterium AH-259-A15]
MVNLLVLFALLLVPFVLSSLLASPPNLKVNLAEFIFEQAPFAQCHASTIVELPSGDLLAAWFGGKREGDDSVQIWLSRKPTGGTWLSPEVVTNFPESPCWNPVLFRVGASQRPVHPQSVGSVLASQGGEQSLEAFGTFLSHLIDA